MGSGVCLDLTNQPTAIYLQLLVVPNSAYGDNARVSLLGWRLICYIQGKWLFKYKDFLFGILTRRARRGRARQRSGVFIACVNNQPRVSRPVLGSAPLSRSIAPCHPPMGGVWPLWPSLCSLEAHQKDTERLRLTFLILSLVSKVICTLTGCCIPSR